MESHLLDLLVCPICKGPLEIARAESKIPFELICRADRLAFPIQDDIPIMLTPSARSLDDTVGSKFQ